MFLPESLRPQFVFLLHARSKYFFFTEVERLHPRGSEGYKLIAKAYKILHHECHGRRRQSGEREAEHPTRAALTAMIICHTRDANKIAALLLHDMIETFRGKWSIERLSREFNPIVGELVGHLTKPVQSGRLITDKALERVYRRQLRNAGPDVIELKSYDVFDNVITLWGRSHPRMRRKVEDVEKNLLPLMRAFQTSCVNELEQVLEYILHWIDNIQSLELERTG